MAALKEQMATADVNWEQEKNKLMESLESARARRKIMRGKIKDEEEEELERPQRPGRWRRRPVDF